MSAEQFKGIDSRIIKCCDPSKTCIQAGISFDEREGGHILMFHFLEVQHGQSFVRQTAKSMWLDKKNRDELVAALKSLRFPRKP